MFWHKQLPKNCGCYLLLALEILALLSCAGNKSKSLNGNGSNSANASSSRQISGVLMWKGNRTGNGVYNESTLNLQNVNPNQFGKVAEHPVDGTIIAQPIYISQLDMGAAGTHD